MYLVWTGSQFQRRDERRPRRHSVIVTSRPGALPTTAQVAKQLGISSRTLERYAERGWVTPARVLPSGHRRWSLEDVRCQLDALRDQDTD